MTLTAQTPWARINASVKKVTSEMVLRAKRVSVTEMVINRCLVSYLCSRTIKRDNLKKKRETTFGRFKNETEKKKHFDVKITYLASRFIGLNIMSPRTFMLHLILILKIAKNK